MTSAVSFQRILVTGGAGFLGSHVVEQLRAVGAQHVFPIRSKDVDLTDPHATRALFEQVKPDLVLHLAARVGGIGLHVRHPGVFFRDNMAMGLSVLEEARRAGTRKVVIAGSVGAYPKMAQVPFREEELWNGFPEENTAPYGVAKRALITMAQAYRSEFGSNFVTLLPINLYGPRDHFDLESAHVVAAMVRKFVDARVTRQNSVILWGDGTATREFLYVEDAARAFLLAAERYDGAEPVNLGTGREVSIRELAAAIANISGFGGDIVWDTTRPNGHARRSIDVSRAKERFGFEASTPLEEGLRRTIAWYEANREAILSR